MNRYLGAEHIQLVHSGKNYFEIMERLINGAREVIHLQTYIFETDETGMRIIQALLRAAARGVTIYILADAFGSYPFSKEAAKQMKEAGINFRLFAPLFSSESVYFGRRLHHKILVADKHTSLTGGINIANKYNQNKESDPWLDYAILCRGEVSGYLHLLCHKIYRKQNAKDLRIWENSFRYKISGNKRLVRFRRNDWLKGSNEIHKSYVHALLKAKKSVTIVASYFLPGAHFRKLLQMAAARGVEVKVILAGTSDIASVRLAENYLYDFYLRNNIRIYEWRNSVMHGKAMLVDDFWVTIGSYNLNYLSHYISIELNADVIDIDFARQFKTHLDDIAENHCHCVKKEVFTAERNWFGRVKIWLAYSFYRLLMNLMLTAKRYRNRKNT
jgi:cardiolipin synthase A/B